MKIIKKILSVCGRYYKIVMLCFLCLAMIIAMLGGRDKKIVPLGDSSISSEYSSSLSSNGEDNLPEEQVSAVESEEMRAVWVPYMTLAMSKDQGKEEFTEKFSKIVSNSALLGMNTLIVQVRPFSDALYKSDYYPWSHILSEEQGKDPGYDPLEIMVSLCHKAKIKIHAWVNPLRISTEHSPKVFASSSPYTIWTSKDDTKDYIMHLNGAKYMNPAYEDVRSYIIKGVAEIVRNYDVDGIQFDDYFYPANAETIDEKAYNSYISSVSSDITLQVFRKQNINTLIAGVYRAIKEEKPEVVFGISPQGNLENNYLFSADVQAWGSISGYVDYLCPQMYVSLDHELLPFEDTLTRWRELVSNDDIKLYVGLGVYKAGTDADGGTWQGKDDILATQVQIGRELDFDGIMFYSYDYLFDEQTKKEVENVIALLN